MEFGENAPTRLVCEQVCRAYGRCGRVYLTVKSNALGLAVMGAIEGRLWEPRGASQKCPSIAHSLVPAESSCPVFPQ